MTLFIACVVLLLVAVLELVRRHKLREEFSWLWIGACVLFIGLAVAAPVREWLSARITSAPDVPFLLLAVSLFLVAICLDFSIQVSSQSNHIKNLAQEVALLRKTVEELQSDDSER